MSKDTDYKKTFAELRAYIAQTNGDKYATSPVDMLAIAKHPQVGTAWAVCNAIKYLNRYLTRGHQKSNNREDLLKAVHYILMELDKN